MKWKQLTMPREVLRDQETSTSTYGRFVIEPLERGFGTTLGNALRRVLLSSVQGTAITAIRIDNVLHEYTTIPGVHEDVVELVLNLKQVRIRLLGSEPKPMLLDIKKKGTVTAADLQCDPSMQIVNPTLHLAEFTENGRFRVEMDTAVGRGYVPAEENRKEQQPIGTIPIDAIFSPIRRVNYLVEDARVGQRTDYDKLTLDIETDGTMPPEEALGMSARILRDHLGIFTHLDEGSFEVEEEKVDEDLVRIKSLLSKTVEELELSVRSSNCLKAANIKSIDELVQKSEPDMLKYRNFGKKSLQEIAQVLASYGLHFGMDLSKYR